jgi:hypothetical protein
MPARSAPSASVRTAAAEMGIGLTPLETVIQGAFAAVETVNLRIADLQKTGGMKEINAEFKEARRAGMGLDITTSCRPRSW